MEHGRPDPGPSTTGASRLVLAFYANKKSATFSNYTAPAVERFDAPNNPGGLPSNAMASYELPAAGESGAKSAVASEQDKWVAQQIAITPAAGATVTRFLWDINQGLPQLALERDGNNSPLRSYTYGERRISQTSGSTTSYFHHDGLGSVSNLTSSAGATQWTYAHEPFGATRIETSNSGPTNFMKFTGEYLDPTGLYHLRARQYDPASGRFLSVDPLAQQLNQPLVGTYVYAQNQPSFLVDPSGEGSIRPTGISQSSARIATSVTAAGGQGSPKIKIPKGAYCGGAVSADYFEEGRLSIRLRAKCKERIGHYSVSWRIAHAGMLDSGSDPHTQNWGKKNVKWDLTFDEDFELSRFMTFTATMALYGFRFIARGPFRIPGVEYLYPQIVEYSLKIFEPRVP